LYVKNYLKIIKNKANNQKLLNIANTLLFANLLEILFYPLFMISTTFMRFVTSLSITTILYTGYDEKRFLQRERLSMIGYGLLILCGFYFINIFLSGYWEYTIKPMFDSYYFKF
jgi:hypothetical protein